VGTSHIAAPDLPCGKATLRSSVGHSEALEPAGRKAAPRSAVDHVAARDLTLWGGRSRSWHSGVDPVFRL
jgi:hypothetical protein